MTQRFIGVVAVCRVVCLQCKDSSFFEPLDTTPHETEVPGLALLEDRIVEAEQNLKVQYTLSDH